MGKNAAPRGHARPVFDGFSSTTQVKVESALYDDDSSSEAPRRRGLSNCAKGCASLALAVALAIGGVAWWVCDPLGTPAVPQQFSSEEELQQEELTGDAIDVFAEFVSLAQGKYENKGMSTSSSIPMAETALKSAIPSMRFGPMAKAQADSPPAFTIDFEISWMSKKLITRVADHLVHLTTPMTVWSNKLRPGEGVQKLVLQDGQACYMYRMFMRRDDDPENFGNWVDPMDIYQVAELTFFYNKCIPWKAKGQTVGDLNRGMYVREGRPFSRQKLVDLRKAVEDTAGSLDPSVKDKVVGGSLLSEASFLGEMSSVLEGTIDPTE